MRKLLAILAAVLMLFSLGSCGEKRYMYDPKLRQTRMDFGCYAMAPGLETNVICADLVAVVRVASAEPLMKKKERIGDYFSFDIEEVWFGETDLDQIRVYIFATEISPYINDELVVFLREENPEKYDYWILATDEDSMFAINPPDDTLYSFSDNPLLTSFDGLPPEKLKEAIAEVSEEIGKEW